ncbi:hypothetical protein Y032_0683g1496 [Ancylostoma ceylanicum]|uniref:Uncharacterized protein n=1 Tax=Ancylostoma ceylanicum TaxID=53326 RepID=A0A016WH66_9BILA|nr:hypothetical protein Y032_0683g1496 [Ancylostoma ceylanicum]
MRNDPLVAEAEKAKLLENNTETSVHDRRTNTRTLSFTSRKSGTDVTVSMDHNDQWCNITLYTFLSVYDVSHDSATIIHSQVSSAQMVVERSNKVDNSDTRK